MMQQAPYQEELHDNSFVETNSSVTLEENKTITSPVIYGDNQIPDERGFDVVEKFSKETTISSLGNQYSTLMFSNHTGGIREVKIHQFERMSKSFSMPQKGEPLLGLSFENINGEPLKSKIPDPRAFKLERKDKDVVYTWESNQKLRIERVYSRDANETYGFKHRTKITNAGNQPLNLERMRLHLGSAFQIPRMYNPFDNASTYLNVGYFNAGPALPEGCSCATCSGRIDGEAEEFIQLNEMGPDGKMDTRFLSQARWACVNNQFFVNLVRPANDMADVRISGKSTQQASSVDDSEVLGISGNMSFPVGLLQPGESREFNFNIYSGPKDFMGLQRLGAEQKKVMQFGVFWWISEPLSWALNYLSGLLGSYGLGIIALTILVKLLLWPLTAQATRSQKKMQALQGPMSKLREKHKGNSQKLNQEMMKFYKEHKVNPFAGCWPILIQIPIFLGMFWMLRSASELYGQSFLWAKDLSEQDSIATLQGFSINLLPIFMVATQWYQMRLNPMQMGPEMSEAQRINAKMMRFMPFMFLVFLYFFSSALVLYWTVQNLMTILQTLVTKTNQEKITSPKIASSEDNNDEELSNRTSKIEISEDERRNRNLLGLKVKGPVNRKKLEENFKSRMLNYDDKKLESMSASKRRASIQKKNNLQIAYDELISKCDKDS